MDQTWLLREGHPKEAPTVLDLWRLAFEEEDTHGDEEDVERALTYGKGTRFLVAEVAGVVAGALIVSFDGWRGNMYRLAVLPEFQRLGIAMSLVKEAEGWLDSLGCKKITALVVGNHGKATGFWEAAGYSHEKFMRRYARRLGT